MKFDSGRVIIFFKNPAQPQKSSRNLHTNMKKLRERKISFIVALLLLIIVIPVKAQKFVENGDKNLPERLILKPAIENKNDTRADFSTGFSRYDQKPFSKSRLYISQTLPSNLYTQHLGFFCEKEWEIEKSSRIPLRFRLGSLQYCDYLEGKNHQ